MYRNEDENDFYEDGRDPDRDFAGRIPSSPFANWSAVLGLMGFFTLMIPFVPLLIGVLSVVFGILSLHRGEYRPGRAVLGIVLGSCLSLLGIVLIYSIAALMPYEKELAQLWSSFSKSYMFAP